MASTLGGEHGVESFLNSQLQGPGSGNRRGAGFFDGGFDLRAEGVVLGLVEPEQALLEQLARRPAHAQEFRQVFHEAGAMAGEGVEADQFGEGLLVQRIERAGAFEGAPGGGGGPELEQAFCKEQGIVGAQAGLADELRDLQFAFRRLAEAEQREGVEAVEQLPRIRGGFRARVRRRLREVGCGAVVEGDHEGLHVGDEEEFAGQFPETCFAGEAGGEVRLAGLGGKAGELEEGAVILREDPEIGVDLAGLRGPVAGGTIGVQEVDPWRGIVGLVELAQERVAARVRAVAASGEMSAASSAMENLMPDLSFERCLRSRTSGGSLGIGGCR